MTSLGFAFYDGQRFGRRVFSVAASALVIARMPSAHHR
jgi:hypothetical protein